MGKSWSMKLTDYLAREKMTATAFAARINVPVSTVTRLLANERSPRLDLLVKIRTATSGEVTPNDFADTFAEARP